MDVLMAGHSGRCGWCDGEIEKGDDIIIVDGEWCHEYCNEEMHEEEA